MRLDKLLGQAGFGSRNQVKKLIRSRQVYVDGRLAEADNLNVETQNQPDLIICLNAWFYFTMLSVIFRQ